MYVCFYLNGLDRYVNKCGIQYFFYLNGLDRYVNKCGIQYFFQFYDILDSISFYGNYIIGG
jgi:hypothetical protein